MLMLRFRRILLALLQLSYKRLPPIDEPHIVRTLSAREANEYAQLAILSPLMVTDIAADYAPRVIATDASDVKGAAVVAAVPEAVHRELWRHRERRGGYTWMGSRFDEEFGADKDRRNSDGQTPLMLAAQTGQLGISPQGMTG